MIDGPSELPLLLGPGHGEPERLLLIGAPGDGGVVRVRIWASDNWGATPRIREEPGTALLEWIETMARAGHSLNQSLDTVRRWLRGTGAPTH